MGIRESYETCISITVDPESATFQCDRVWNSQANLFWFNLTWILPSYLHQDDVITRFRIDFKMQNEQGRTLLDVPSVPPVYHYLPLV